MRRMPQSLGWFPVSGAMKSDYLLILVPPTEYPHAIHNPVAAEKELAAQRDDVEALTKEFEQQLDKELAAYEKAQSDLADQRDKFCDMASSFREQFEQETEQRQKLDGELDTLKRNRAMAATSKKARPKKAAGTINSWLVLAVFALTFGAAWILTSDGAPVISQLSELQDLAESIWAPIDEPD